MSAVCLCVPGQGFNSQLSYVFAILIRSWHVQDSVPGVGLVDAGTEALLRGHVSCLLYIA